jgi:hypothetical protein
MKSLFALRSSLFALRSSLFAIVFTISIFFPINNFAQICNGGGIVKNNSFENIQSGASCSPITTTTTTGSTIISIPDAFSNNCVTDWEDANGTPDLFLQLQNGVNTISAFQGNHFALLAHAPIAGGPCDNPIFQNIQVSAGNEYEIGFYSLNPFPNLTGKIAVFLANNIQNLNSSGVPCFAIHPSWQKIATFDVTLSSWKYFSTIFVPSNPSNNQLLFVAESSNFLGVNIALDAVSIDCVSHLNSSISSTYLGGGDYLFSSNTLNSPGTTNVPTGWCWSFGDGSFASGSSFIHHYQVDGNFNIMLKVTDSFGCVGTTNATIEHNDCKCADVPIIIKTNKDWTGITKIIDKDVIIAPLATLTINQSTLPIKSTCKFIVMRGAKLNINNSTLSAYCSDKPWEGIIVWGNSNVQHLDVNLNQSSVNNPGILMSTNHSTFTNMNRGLQAQRWWWDGRNESYFNSIMGGAASNIPEFWGGLIQMDDCNFDNNKLCAEFHKYSSVNLSYFKNCNFLSSANSKKYEGVNIWATNNIHFSGCNFSNHKLGITVIDGAITVKSSSFNSEVNGIVDYGLSYISAETKIGTGLEIDKNTFDKNDIGMNNWQMLGVKIRKNDFLSNKTGVKFSQFATYDISENNFGGVYGIHLFKNYVDDAGLVEQDITCNDFSSSYGIFADDDCSAMIFDKNEFNCLNADIFVKVSSAVFPYQGSSGEPALNLFSESELVPDFANLGNFVTYFPPFVVGAPNTSARLKPDCDQDDLNCTTNYYFINAPDQTILQTQVGNCITINGYCGEKPCYDSLINEREILQKQINQGQISLIPDAKRLERHINSSKNRLIEKWVSTNDVSSIEAFLIASNLEIDKKILFSAYMKLNLFQKASSTLNSINDVDFVAIEQIYLKYQHATITEYLPEAIEIENLKGIAINPLNSNQGFALGLITLLKIPFDLPEQDPDLTETPSKNRTSSPNFSKKLSTLHFYPNPTNDYIQIESIGAFDHLAIINVFGELVKNSSINPHENNLELYVGDLKDGIYQIVAASSSNKYFLGKLCIKH